MSRNAQHFADRLRSALRFHSHDPRHRGSGQQTQAVTLPRKNAAGTPGEEFARRLREAIDA